MMDFESLYAKYAPAVRRFVLFLCGDPMMADDITSDTFLRALGKHEQIRQPTVKSYLLTIARNIYRDYGRKRARHPEAELHESIPDGRERASVARARRGNSRCARGVAGIAGSGPRKFPYARPRRHAL
jgi:RNA polymerase sigma factor (sigma-70 family)